MSGVKKLKIPFLAAFGVCAVVKVFTFSTKMPFLAFLLVPTVTKLVILTNHHFHFPVFQNLTESENFSIALLLKKGRGLTFPNKASENTDLTKSSHRISTV